MRRVAAAIVQRADGKVLLLKRAPSHRTDPNKWCFVTGYIEAGESPRQAAMRELAEELNVMGVEPEVEGALVQINRPDVTLYIHPYLFHINHLVVELEKEHSAFVWIYPQEITQYDTVPQLADDLIAVGLL